MGRAMPQRSLPPCGGGTGRGVAAFGSYPRSASPHAARSPFCGREESRLQCFVATPLPVPPPQGGREPCGAHLRTSHDMPCVQRCVHALVRRRGPIATKLSVIAGPATSPCCGVWVPACAGTTAESYCFTSSFASFAGTNRKSSLHRRDHELGAFLDAGGPARGDGLGLGIETDRVRPVLIEIAETRALPAAERVIGKRHGDRE